MTRDQVLDLLYPEVLHVRANITHKGEDLLFDYEGNTYINWATLLSYLSYNNLLKPDENLQKALIRLLQSKYIQVWELISGEPIPDL